MTQIKHQMEFAKNTSPYTLLLVIIIINTLGQVVFNEKMNAGKVNLDILNFANGIYFVNVIQDNKQQSVKIIKE